MKTRMKQIAAGTILALLITGGNVQAKGTEVKASVSETVENTLELENWMVDDKIWNTKTLTWVVEDTDENLKLENWMTNEQTWKLNHKVKTVIEKESKLELEKWMLNNKIWKN